MDEESVDDEESENEDEVEPIYMDSSDDDIKDLGIDNDETQEEPRS